MSPGVPGIKQVPLAQDRDCVGFGASAKGELFGDRVSITTNAPFSPGFYQQAPAPENTRAHISLYLHLKLLLILETTQKSPKKQLLEVAQLSAQWRQSQLTPCPKLAGPCKILQMPPVLPKDLVFQGDRVWVPQNSPPSRTPVRGAHTIYQHKIEQTSPFPVKATHPKGKHFSLSAMGLYSYGAAGCPGINQVRGSFMHRVVAAVLGYPEKVGHSRASSLALFKVYLSSK